MKIPEYSTAEEQVVGTYRTYPAVQGMYEEYGMPLADSEPKIARPITRRENFLRVLEGKTPCWLPFGGMSTDDVRCFMPRQNPDNFVSHLVQDGGEEKCQFPSLVLNSDWFDLDWEYMPAAHGATVHPGKPKLTDMTEWEKYFSLPDLDRIDWDGLSEMNQEYVSTDKVVILNILSGPWERLMSLMDVENAAMAMIDEDQADGIHRFFDRYCDFFDDYIGRVSDRLRLDGVLMHDDWGHQNAPFFSHSTAEEMLFPYLKRIVASCHKRGLFYEQHSCGRNESFLDLYIEAGVNLYCPQNINDFDLMLEKCKGSQLVIGVPLPEPAYDAPDEVIAEEAEKWFDHYKGNRFVSSALFKNPALNRHIYKLSRNYYAGMDV